jgi:hypothetical protein
VYVILGFKPDGLWVTDSVAGFLKPQNDKLNSVTPADGFRHSLH